MIGLGYPFLFGLLDTCRWAEDECREGHETVMRDEGNAKERVDGGREERMEEECKGERFVDCIPKRTKRVNIMIMHL
jgi:hypothetical protein